MSSILKGLNELNNNTLASYKKKAGADATAADKAGDTKKADKRFSGIVKATKKQFANDEKQLKEFAPVGGDDREPDEEEILRQLAAKWWLGTEQEMSKAQKTLAAMGWDIGQDESGDDDAGVFVIRVGDENGDSYIAFNHSDLEELNEAYNKYHANRTGFSRGQRDDERHDLDVPRQPSTEQWALKINGKVDGSNIFNSREQALKHRLNLLAKNPELEIGLVTKGGVAEEQLDELSCWTGYHRVAGTKAGFPGSCAKNKTNEQGVAEDSIGDKIKGAAKSVKRAAQGWGVGGAPDMVTPKGVVQAFGNMDGQRLANFVASRKELSTPSKDSARAFADKVIDREMKQRGYGRVVDKDEQGVAEDDAGDVEQRMINKIAKYKEHLAHLKKTDPAAYKREMEKHKQTNRIPPVSTFEGHSESCPHCGGEMVSEELMNEKKDACYYKVKSRYKVWPSAYASGALVKCRNKGAKNWGNGGKKNESVAGDEDIRPQGKILKKLHDIAYSSPTLTFQNFRQSGKEDIITDAIMACKVLKHYYLQNKNQPTAQIIYNLENELTDFRRGRKLDTPDGNEYTMDLSDLMQRTLGKMRFQQKVDEDQIDEKWTKKYKDSINCSNPKGFSQKAHCAGKQKNESSILEGIERADESLHDWFNKEKWVRMDTKGNIKGPCAKEPGEGKPKCLPQSKAHSLGKKGRASAAQRKRREDPNPERSGKAINVDTKKSKG